MASPPLQEEYRSTDARVQGRGPHAINAEGADFRFLGVELSFTAVQSSYSIPSLNSYSCSDFHSTFFEKKISAGGRCCRSDTAPH